MPRLAFSNNSINFILNNQKYTEALKIIHEIKYEGILVQFTLVMDLVCA